MRMLLTIVVVVDVLMCYCALCLMLQLVVRLLLQLYEVWSRLSRSSVSYFRGRRLGGGRTTLFVRNRARPITRAAAQPNKTKINNSSKNSNNNQQTKSSPPYIEYTTLLLLLVLLLLYCYHGKKKEKGCR
jgi:hypothetical protein